MAAITLREAAAALATSHVIFSAVGVGNAAMQKPDTAAAATAAGDVVASGAKAVKVVARMYSGGGLDAAACAGEVTFTDPAARCEGVGEVSEAFRALKWCRPETIEAPRAQPVSDSELLVHLHQRYFGFLVVRSALCVKLSADGRVAELEERWNGAPLLWWSPFRWTRRVNGMLSSLLTPLLLR